MDGENLVVQIEKNFVLGMSSFLFVFTLWEDVYAYFLQLDDVIIPWEPTNRDDFVAQIFLDSRL